MDQILHETGEISREKYGFSRANSFTLCFIRKSFPLLASLRFLISTPCFLRYKVNINLYLFSINIKIDSLSKCKFLLKTVNNINFINV